MALWFSLILILIVFYTIVFVLFSKIKFCDLFIIQYSVFSWLMFPDLLGWWKWHSVTQEHQFCVSVLDVKKVQGSVNFVHSRHQIFCVSPTIHPEKKNIYKTFLVWVSACCRKEPCIAVILDCCRFILPFNLHFATCLCGFIYNIHICIFLFCFIYC